MRQATSMASNGLEESDFEGAHQHSVCEATKEFKKNVIFSNEERQECWSLVLDDFDLLKASYLEKNTQKTEGVLVKHMSLVEAAVTTIALDILQVDWLFDFTLGWFYCQTTVFQWCVKVAYVPILCFLTMEAAKLCSSRGWFAMHKASIKLSEEMCRRAAVRWHSLEALWQGTPLLLHSMSAILVKAAVVLLCAFVLQHMLHTESDSKLANELNSSDSSVVSPWLNTTGANECLNATGIEWP
jgi:hypothetical protein